MKLSNYSKKYWVMKSLINKKWFLRSNHRNNIWFDFYKNAMERKNMKIILRKTRYSRNFLRKEVEKLWSKEVIHD